MTRTFLNTPSCSRVCDWNTRWRTSLGIRSSRHQGVSPPTNSPPRDHLATNHLATKQSLLATNNLTTVNHKPKRLIRCLCYVEQCAAIRNQATSYNSLVLSHNDSNNALSISTMLKFCLINDSNHQQFVVHFNDAKVLSHKRLEQFLQCLKSTATT